MLIWIGVATIVMTLLGGLFAIRFKDKLHLILGFSAGAVLGVAFFDLLPEAINLGNTLFDTGVVTSYIAGGFILYMLVDRFASFHTHTDDDDCDSKHHHSGKLGPISLSLHSLLDGIAIGLSYQFSTSVGLIVTAAVLAHDFSDGLNTVSLSLKNNKSVSVAKKWLFIDATAPMVGIISTYFFTLDDKMLTIVLALFCGFFLYIGASDLLPESHHQHPARWTTMSTLLGMGFIYFIISLV